MAGFPISLRENHAKRKRSVVMRPTVFTLVANILKEPVEYQSIIQFHKRTIHVYSPTGHVCEQPPLS